MKAEATSIHTWKKLLEVEVSTDEITPYIEEAYRSYKKKIHVEGFRKGKVPMSIIRKRFGDAIRAEVSEDLVQTFFRKAVEEKNLSLISPGVIKDVSFGEGKPLKFTAEIAVEPEIEVKNYRGLKFEKEIVKTTSEDVDQAIRILQEQKAEINSVNSEAKTGYLVEGDVQALNENGIPIVGHKWEDRVIVLGEPPLGDQIQDQLLGVREGEDRRFKVIQFENERGVKIEKEQRYSIHVKAVKEKRLPEITDGFAQSVGEFKTVSDLKDAVHRQLDIQRERESEDMLRRRIMDEVIRRNDFEIPEPMIENALNLLWENYSKQSKEKVDEDAFKSEHKPRTLWNLKWQIIWKKIADMENIAIGDDEIDEEIEKAARAKPGEAEKIRIWYRDPQHRNRLKLDFLESKTIQFIKSNGKVKENIVKKPKRKHSSIVTP